MVKSFARTGYASRKMRTEFAPLDGMAPKLGELGRVQDAYLAATAEQLACANAFPIPAWVAADDRKLHRPWFASPLAALRAVLLLESPPAFRSRNLFISENALTRA